MMHLVVPSCIRGYHVYGEIWTAVLNEQLSCKREIGNVVDRYAVVAKNDLGITVGHVPQKISRICSIFLMGGGTITATVTGQQRYSSDLAQVGLEIPCNLKFSGEEEKISKLKKVLRQKKKLASVVTLY